MVALTATSAKSPLTAIEVIFSVAVPLLVTTTFFPAVVVPTTFLPNDKDAGAKLIPGPPLPDPANAAISALPFGLPHPVTKS